MGVLGWLEGPASALDTGGIVSTALLSGVGDVGYKRKGGNYISKDRNHIRSKIKIKVKMNTNLSRRNSSLTLFL